MITGDNNLLEVQATVRYTIRDPRVFLFEVGEPEKVLRNAAESALREVVAGRGMAALLTADRGRFGRLVRERLEGRCEASRPGGLGIRIEGVSLHDLHPPQEVVQAYHEVTRAMERRDRMVNDANADRLRREREQEARSKETVRTAEAEGHEMKRNAEALNYAFCARHHARSRLSLGEELSLLSDALAAGGAGRPQAEVKDDYTKRRRGLLGRQRAQADFRLYWDALADALGGRAKVLIAAERMPTRRMLWLGPFDSLFAPTRPGAAAPRPRQGDGEP
jgi:hypothetical protein